MEKEKTISPKLTPARELRNLLAGNPSPRLVENPPLTLQLLQETLEGKREPGFEKAAVLTLAASIDIAALLKNAEIEAVHISPEEAERAATTNMDLTDRFEALREIGNAVLEQTTDAIQAKKHEREETGAPNHFHQAYEAMKSMIGDNEKLTENAAWEVIYQRLLIGDGSALSSSRQLWEEICSYMQRNSLAPSFIYAAASFSHSLGEMMNLTTGDIAFMEYMLGNRTDMQGDAPNLSTRDVVSPEGESYTVFYFSAETRHNAQQKREMLRRNEAVPFYPTRPITENDEDVFGCYSMPGGEDLGPSLVYTMLQLFARNLEVVVQQVS